MGATESGSKPVDTSLSQAIVEAIASEEGIDPTEVEPPTYEPLYSVVDPEALDSLFAPTLGVERGRGAVSLTYAGYDVTVNSDGRVDLSPIVDEE